ncbi:MULTISPECIES: NAD(P)H-binding protein [unclassified Streptomyces]|uniref:NAD(P)H-binding protein n=1 Tax=unclassified Streptomyces TaxID=2593676 RepID=UPI000DABCD6E|nr:MULTISPECIES: NAD(P)H-binding protein [unclassified Streptomyces]PZT72453.1 NmrA family transcriptional regulator [Streptomyces sp. AC1-42T]PZT81228.1 NmrA family transcriptional regulator [Streptomyces sp. AC1-42W]
MLTLVTGCRGRVGSALTALLHQGGHPVRAASRNAAEPAPPPGVPAVTCDLDDPSTFPAALEGVDAVFLYANPAHIDAFLTAARTAGVSHIVLLSSSSVLVPDPATNPIAAEHHAVERALTASPLTTTLLRPGAFATNAYQWSGAFRSGRPVGLPYPRSEGSPIHETDIAEAALAVLTEPALRGAAYHLTGPESLSAAEQVEILAAASGTPVTVEEMSPAAWQEAMSPFMPAGVAEGLLMYWAATDGRRAEVTDAVATLAGHPARTFAAWATEHAAAFRT